MICKYYGCNGLTSVTIPNSVTSIAEGAFQSCSGIKEVNYNATNCSSIWSNNNGGVFSEIINLVSLNIGNNVRSIPANAFRDCLGLTSVTIPNSVTSIGNGAFRNCSGLTCVTIPNSVTKIGTSAFANCLGLKSVTIPNSVTSIAEGAFQSCSGLTSVTIGSGIKTINSYAFRNCAEITDLYCLAEIVPSAYASSFDGSYIEYITLHVPAEAYNSYKETSPWSSFGTIVVIDGDVPGIEIPETPDPQKCATPTIAYKNGKLTFSCATEGVEYVSEVTVADAKKYYDAEVPLTGVYHVTAYAMKTGYDNSDVATADFVVIGSTVTLVGDVNNDGKVDATDITKLIDILLKR